MFTTQPLSAQCVTIDNEVNVNTSNVGSSSLEHEQHNKIAENGVNKLNAVLNDKEHMKANSTVPFISSPASSSLSTAHISSVEQANTAVLPQYHQIHNHYNYNNDIKNYNNNSNSNNGRQYYASSSGFFQSNMVNNVNSGHLMANDQSMSEQMTNRSSFSIGSNDYYKHRSPTSPEMMLPSRMLHPRRFHPGSLGTPTIIGALAQHPSMTNLSVGSFSSSAATSSYQVNSYLSTSVNSHPQHDTINTKLCVNEFGDVILPESRELLKALAKQCKPQPPWCVGSTVPPELHEEAEQFARFCCPTQNEIKIHEAQLIKVHSIIQQIWPNAKLCLMGPSAAGLVAGVENTMHYYLVNATYTSGDYYNVLSSSASKCGLNLTFREDARGATCVTFIDANVEHKLSVRYGERAVVSTTTADIFTNEIANNHAARSAYAVLLALLSQAKLLDDVGVTSETIGPEAVGIMLLSVLRSYDTSDKPDAGRLLLDFLLTYGFETYFDIKKSSVDIRGMLNPPSKIHTAAELSVLDPGDRSVNLTPKFNKTKHLQAVFNYAYTALTQYAQLSNKQRKAQSALSTIIGGQPFWGRVLDNYHHRIEPYYSAVHAKVDVLTEYVETENEY